MLRAYQLPYKSYIRVSSINTHYERRIVHDNA